MERGSRAPTNWKVEESDRSYYVIGLVDSYDGDPDTMLLARGDGDVDTPRSPLKMLSALYDLYQTHDGLMEGDTFSTPHGYFATESFHVVPGDVETRRAVEEEDAAKQARRGGSLYGLGATFTQDKQPYGPSASGLDYGVADTRLRTTRYRWFSSPREAAAWNKKYRAGFQVKRLPSGEVVDDPQEGRFEGTSRRSMQMPAGISSIDIEFILDGMARALWVDAWANEVESRGGRAGGPGVDLMDVAPPTPDAARQLAGMLMSKYAAANQASMTALLSMARDADQQWRMDNTPGPEEYARTFGHYLAMQSLGHGVSWFDDHGRFPLVVPPFENYSLADLV